MTAPPTGNYPTGGSGPPNVGGGNGGGGWGWIVPIIGSVVGGILDKASQDSTNKANAQNVDKQIAFQTEQNATAYQRAVADMRAAGLNPGLAYQQGKAGSGTGAAAENRAVTHGQRLTQAVDAYNQLANGTAQRQLMREQAGATAASAMKTQMEAGIIAPDANAKTDRRYWDARKDEIMARTAADTYLSNKTEEQYLANLRNTNQGTSTAAAHASLLRTEATLNEQEFQNEWFRKNVSPFINSTAKATSLLENFTRTGKGYRELRTPERLGREGSFEMYDGKGNLIRRSINRDRKY